MDPSREKEVEDEYLSSLMDLNLNSKPLINMLTMLAEDNLEFAHVIVRAIEKHITQVNPDAKLPILYLIDSIVKNVGNKYKQIFAQNIVSIFCDVFKKVNEKVREKMFNLRQTWNEVFPPPKLYALDVKVNVMDNNWPITAKVVPKSVHVNPNFLKNSKDVSKAPPQPKDVFLHHQMQAKERELLELKQKKIELELMMTKKKIAEQEKEIQQGYMMPSESSFAQQQSVMNSGVPHSMKVPPPQLPPTHGRVRIAPASAAMVSSARDPRLSKLMRNQQMENKITTPSFPMVPPANSIRSLPRIPKHNKSSSSTTASSSKDEREERDPRKRRDRDRDEKSSSKGESRDRSKSSSSSSSKSPSSKKSHHDSPRKRSGDDEKRSSSKSSSHHHHHKSSSSRSHSSHSKSPSKSGSKSPNDNSKDVDLRNNISAESLAVAPSLDVDMRPDSTTAAAAAAANSNNKLNKNKLLNELLQDEDMRSSQDSLISTSNDNGKEQIINLTMTMKMSLIFVS